MNRKYLAIAILSTLSILSLSSVAKAALTANALTANGLHVNALTANGLNITGTMPQQTGLTLSTSDSTSIQVENGHLVLVK